MSRAQLSRIRAVSGFAAGVTAVVFTALVRNNDLLVTARVSVADAAVAALDVCDDAGKVRVFKDMDDFIKRAAQLSLFASGGVSMGFSNMVALEPAPFTGDLIKRAQTALSNYQNQKSKLVKTSAAQVNTLALMTTNTQAETALKAEKQAQHDAVVAQLAWVTSEVTRLTELLA
jgi:hypothetical protein